MEEMPAERHRVSHTLVFTARSEETRDTLELQLADSGNTFITGTHVFLLSVPDASRYLASLLGAAGGCAEELDCLCPL
jgi:hypothetical protein